MRLTSSNVGPSPDNPDACRVTVGILLEKTAKELNFWFDVPRDRQDQISSGGNAWLTLMMPIAMAVGEDITLEVPVDPHLLENIRGMMAAWHGWFPELREAEIQAPTAPARRPPPGRRAMFFSGGVDSFFTLLRHHPEATGCGDGPVDTLVFVEGFDLPVSAREETSQARRDMQLVASEFGKTLLNLSTNLRELDTPYKHNWILAHGCAMATVMHLLDTDITDILVSSSRRYSHLVHIGTHPLTDPLLSSRRLRFVHDGASFSRTEKIAQVGRSETALRFLRVCYESRQYKNCSRCPKCLLTMAAIDTVGLPDKAVTFDWSAYKPESLGGLVLRSNAEQHRISELMAAAAQVGRADLVTALQRSVERSVNANRALRAIRHLPYLWRFEHQLYQHLSRPRAARR